MSGNIANPAQFTRFIWDRVLSYLNKKVGLESARSHMADPAANLRLTLSAIYRRLLESLKNRQAMANTIGSLDRLNGILCEFDPHKVRNEYGDDWTKLLTIAMEVLPIDIDITNTRGYWVHFAKGVIDAARLFKDFSDPESFIQFVHDFYDKPTTRPALPMLLAVEIHGFGFALACDFLKEVGFNQYVKPDVHLIEIFSQLGLSTKLPLDVFRAICKFADEVNETPYAVDKAFWLIGSGKLYRENRRFITSREEFTASVKNDWNHLTQTTPPPPCPRP